MATVERSEIQQAIPGPRMQLELLPTLAVSGVTEHIKHDKGLDMVDKAGVGGNKANLRDLKAATGL